MVFGRRSIQELIVYGRTYGGFEASGDYYRGHARLRQLTVRIAQAPTRRVQFCEHRRSGSHLNGPPFHRASALGSETAARRNPRPRRAADGIAGSVFHEHLPCSCWRTCRYPLSLGQHFPPQVLFLRAGVDGPTKMAA
ncbi:hypothetical protein VTI28DRAFT_6381 [Corynascus sepedonium]